ncbi:hypothetical protein ACJX0J_005764, partial [Zea mays]
MTIYFHQTILILYRQPLDQKHIKHIISAQPSGGFFLGTGTAHIFSFSSIKSKYRVLPIAERKYNTHDCLRGEVRIFITKKVVRDL